MAMAMRRALRLRSALRSSQMRSVFSQPPRSAAAAAAVDVQHHQPPSALKDMSDEEVVDMVLRREIPAHNLEKVRR